LLHHEENKTKLTPPCLQIMCTACAFYFYIIAGLPVGQTNSNTQSISNMVSTYIAHSMRDATCSLQKHAGYKAADSCNILHYILSSLL